MISAYFSHKLEWISELLKKNACQSSSGARSSLFLKIDKILSFGDHYVLGAPKIIDGKTLYLNSFYLECPVVIKTVRILTVMISLKLEEKIL